VFYDTRKQRLYDDLCRLLPGQFEEVLFRFDSQRIALISPPTVAQSKRAIEVIELANHTSRSCDELVAIVEEVRTNPLAKDDLLNGLKRLSLRQFNLLLTRIKVPASLLPGASFSQDVRAVHLLLLYRSSNASFSELEIAIDGVQKEPHGFYPFLNKRFYGRDKELEQIRQLLQKNRILALSGVGGVGKTHLANQFVSRYEKDFLGGTFWIEATSTVSRDDQFYRILQILEPNIPPIGELLKDNGSLSLRLGRELQPFLDDYPMLWVVDDLPEYSLDESQRDLSYWCPASDRVNVLVTSRIKVASSALCNYVVPPFERNCSIQILTENSDSPLTTAEAEELAEWVGDLPLALELLKASLDQGALTNRELMELCRNSQTTRELDELANDMQEFTGGKQFRGVTKTYGLTYQRLPEGAQKLARLLSFLGAGPIPMALIDELRAGLSRVARTALISRNFIVSETEDTFGTLPRILADFLRINSPDPESERRQVCGCLLSLMTLNRCRDPKEWYLMNFLAPHAASALTHIKEVTEPDAGLALRMGELFQAQGRYAQAAAIQKEWTDKVSRTFGQEHPLASTCFHHLAASLHEQGFYDEACELREKVLNHRLKMLGDAHPDTIASRSSLASTFYSQKKFTEARLQQELVLRSSRELYGDENRETLMAVSDLATTLHAQGWFAESAALLEQAASVSNRMNGNEHPDTLLYKSNLAVVLKDSGNLEAACELQMKVLDLARDSFAEEHPNILRSMNNLADTLRARGSFAEAQKLLERVVKKSQQSLGERHPGTLNILTNLAATMFDRGRLEEAWRLNEKVLRIRSQEFGEHHLDTLKNLSYSAEIRKAQGYTTGVREFEEIILKIRSEKLPKEHSDVLISASNLADTMAAEGDLNGALKLHRQVLTVKTAKLGSEHPSTLVSMGHVANTLLKISQSLTRRGASVELEESLRIYRNLVRISSEKLGDNHPDTLIYKNGLATVLYELGAVSESLMVFNEVLRASDQTLGQSHALTKTVRANMDLLFQ
jgi:tetratricopeptide (TPR) repeat protein